MMNLATKIRAAGESCGRMDGRQAVRKVKCKGLRRRDPFG